jgi:glycosyltransferase involved in cell wall biosynthesis
MSPPLPALPSGWPRKAIADRPVPPAPDGGAWPRVTLVTPSYQQGEFLEDTILSVLNQGYPDLEYFVMDGGSADRTRQILEAYASRLAGLESTADRGQAHAINKGWRRATGKYLWWLNSDDMLMPGALFDAAAALEADPQADLVYGDHIRITGDGRPMDVRTYPAFDFVAFELGNPDVSQPGALMRAEVRERLGDLDEDLHYLMDLDYWRRMALSGCRLVHLERPLALFRIHDEAKTMAGSPQAADERAMLNERLFAHPGLPLAVRRNRPRITSRMHLYRCHSYLLCGDYWSALREAARAAVVWPGQLLRASVWYHGGLAFLGIIAGHRAWRALRRAVRRMRGDVAGG